MKAPRYGQRGAGDRPFYIDANFVAATCPCCMKPHGGETGLMGCFVSDELTLPVLYYLCTSCSRKMARAGRRTRRQLETQIENNLNTLGAFDNIRKAAQA